MHRIVFYHLIVTLSLGGTGEGIDIYSRSMGHMDGILYATISFHISILVVFVFTGVLRISEK